MPRLSIGARWTLRSTAAMMAVVVAMAWVFFLLIEENARNDARIVLDLQTNELVEAVENYGSDGSLPAPLLDYIDDHVDSASGELKLGIRFLDPAGNLRLARGIFLHRDFPSLPGVAERAEQGVVSEVDAGESMAYLLGASAVPGGYVEVAISSRPFLRGVFDLRDRFLETLPLALLLSAAFSFWVARGSLRPIARMTASARRISTSQLDEEIPQSGNGDELDQLAATLNAMMERIRAGVQRIRGFSSTAAHQLRTPLSLMRTRLEIAALSERDAAADQELILAALRDVERLGEAVQGMLRLADSEGGLRPEQHQDVALAKEIEEVVDYFEPVAAKKRISLRVEALPDVTVRGDPDWLRELFSNLVDNALKYTPRGGSVRVEARCSRGEVLVSVADTGPGIDPERLSDIFERFQRGQAPTEVQGAGLGLTIAREIAKAHGGAIEVESAPGKGSTFTTRLPVARAPEA